MECYYWINEPGYLNNIPGITLLKKTLRKSGKVFSKQSLSVKTYATKQKQQIIEFFTNMS